MLVSNAAVYFSTRGWFHCLVRRISFLPTRRTMWYVLWLLVFMLLFGCILTLLPRGWISGTSCHMECRFYAGFLLLLLLLLLLSLLLLLLLLLVLLILLSSLFLWLLLLLSLWLLSWNDSLYKVAWKEFQWPEWEILVTQYLIKDKRSSAISTSIYIKLFWEPILTKVMVIGHLKITLYTGCKVRRKWSRRSRQKNVSQPQLKYFIGYMRQKLDG